jgi:hypothetical protein
MFLPISADRRQVRRIAFTKSWSLGCDEALIVKDDPSHEMPSNVYNIHNGSATTQVKQTVKQRWLALFLAEIS